MVIQAYKISLFKTMSIGCIAGIDANISSIPSVFIQYCMVPFGHFSLMLALKEEMLSVKETHPRKCGCSRNDHFITVLPLYIFRTRPPKIIDSSQDLLFKTIGFTGEKTRWFLFGGFSSDWPTPSPVVPQPPKDSDFFEKSCCWKIPSAAWRVQILTNL